MPSAVRQRSGSSCRDGAFDAGDVVFTALLSMLLVHAAFGRNRRELREVEAQVVSRDQAGGDAFPELSREDEATGANVELEPRLPSAASPPAPPLEELWDDDDPGPAPAAPAPAPSVSLREWTCEIALWHSHGKTAFYARTFCEGEELALAESRPFETEGDIPGQTGAALEAHRALCDELVQAGWQRFGLRHAWYSETFRRDFTVAGLLASLTTRVSFARRPSITG